MEDSQSEEIQTKIANHTQENIVPNNQNKDKTRKSNHRYSQLDNGTISNEYSSITTRIADITTNNHYFLKSSFR